MTPTVLVPVMLQKSRGPDFSRTTASTRSESILMSRIFLEALILNTVMKEYGVLASRPPFTTYMYFAAGS